MRILVAGAAFLVARERFDRQSPPIFRPVHSVLPGTVRSCCDSGFFEEYLQCRSAHVVFGGILLLMKDLFRSQDLAVSVL